MGDFHNFQKFDFSLTSSVNLQDKNGLTPLHGFAGFGVSHLLQYLLSVPNINLSIQDSRGWTPLHWAAFTNSVENVALLLDAGVDLTVVDASSNTPLHSALISGNTEVAKLLFGRTEGLETAGNTGDTVETDFSPLDLLLSLMKERPFSLEIYEAVAKVYLLEEDVSMAKQFLDRSYFIQSEWDSETMELNQCSECSSFIPGNRPHYCCFNCKYGHQICLDCFPLLSSYCPPRFFQEHAFIRVPSEEYPLSISSFIQELKETGVEIPKWRPGYEM